MIENTGVRLIYFNVLEDGLIVMSYFYAKNEQEIFRQVSFKS